VNPICPACGCSLVRLEVSLEDAPRLDYGGTELRFCCEGCRELFSARPEEHLAEIAGWIVCPACLAEKPQRLTVTVEHEGQEVRLCRCPGCRQEFERRPAELLERLAA
jgi:YHS domain-containing protein